MAKKKENKWSKDELSKLRDSLPSNWRDSLSDRHNLSPGSIENIMYGNAINDDVVFSAIELAVEYKEKIQNQKGVIETL